MSQLTTVTVFVDRRAAIKSGINGTASPVQVEIDVSSLNQQDRDDVAERLGTDDPRMPLIDRRGSGKLMVDYYTDRPKTYSYLLTVIEPSQAGIVAALAAQRAEIASIAAQAAIDAANKAAARQQSADLASQMVLVDPALAVCPIRGFDPEGWCHGDGELRTVTTPSGHPSIPFDELTEAAKSAARAYQQVVLSELSARQQRRAERPARLAAERAEWIAAQGSARLKRLAAEGIDHDKTYRSERDKYEATQLEAALAAERPGWRVITEGEIDRDISDVSSRTLALLDAARSLDPSAKLARTRISGKYVAVAKFRGKLIAWPRD